MTQVSIVLCTYNSLDTLGPALDSALTQSLSSEDYEVIVVDDGSTDGTARMVETYRTRHPNLHYTGWPVNKGLTAASNLGLRTAQGQYFIRLDADDTFHAEILSSCIEPLARDETDLVYCDRYDVNIPDGTRSLIEVEPFNLFELTACGTMMRTDMLRDIGGYRNLFWEEYDLYLRYLQRSQRPPVRVPRPLYYYSRHPLSMTADSQRTSEGWDAMKRLWGTAELEQYGWSG